MTQKNHLKAKIVFSRLDILIIYEHVHRLDKNSGSLLNLGLLWQRRKFAESPIDQLFSYFLFLTCMAEKISSLSVV